MELIGPYFLNEEIGRGAMGIVFRGLDPAIGRPVAIKIIQANRFATDHERAELKLRFAREAAAAGKLSHPNIVTVYQLGEQGDQQYLVMELVEGRSLEKALADGQPQDRKQAVSILAQVAEALDYAHGQGIVHRDIKPANILLRTDGEAKITDFGIARIASQTITRTGSSMGTPAYMAPEQITTNKVNGQADQFSLAVIAYQMLSGHRPFVADSDPGLIFKIVSAEPQPLHECDRSFPPGASEVLQKALAKDPNQRFATCAEFVRHLSDALDGRTTPLTPPGPGPRPPRPWAPDWAIALGAVALLIVIVLVVSGVFERRAQRPAEGADAAAPPAAGSGQYAGDLQVNSRDGLKYVWIPPGTFAMGCSPGDNECYGDEKPARQVALPKGFWLGQTDVTQAAYRRVTGSDPSCFKGDNLPVEQVTWDEARSYCQVIGGRLPTEAEWEYAARAGSPAARYGTLDDVAWYAANSGEKTHEVGQKRANAFGLYDMLGNVWQWTEAWYREGGPERALRGGSFVYNPRGVRVSTRIGGEPGSRGSPVGFRCVWE